MDECLNGDAVALYKIKGYFRVSNESPVGQGLMIAGEFIFHSLPFNTTQHTLRHICTQTEFSFKVGESNTIM